MADLDKDKKDKNKSESDENEQQSDSGKKPQSKGGDSPKRAPRKKSKDKDPAKAEEESSDQPKDDVENADDEEQKTYGEEYYYDGFYEESKDWKESDDENEEPPKTDSGGGTITPDDSDSEEEEGEDPEKKKGRKSKKKLDEKTMPFLEHLEELRWTLLRSLLAVFIGAIICFIFSKQIVDFLRLPGPEDLKLIYLSPTEGFMIYIKVALFSGLVLALPFVSYEFWKFVVPGLLAKERKLVPPIVFFTVICFLIGGSFAYLVIIPFAMNFLLGFQTEYLEATITIGKYLGFVVTLILVFGVVFELPVLSFFLSKIGLLTPEFLRSKRRYGIVTIVIIAALLTPPDIVTQIMLAIPLIVLYEISIYVSAIVVRKKEEESEDD